MNTRRLIYVFAVFFALAGLLGACGSDGDDDGATTSSSGSGEPLTAVAYKKRAFEICGQTGEAILQKIGEQFEGQAVKNEAEAYEELKDSVFVPQIEKELEELRSLPAPEASAENVEAMLNALEGGLEDLRAARIRALTDVSQAFPAFDRLAAKNGFQSCTFGGA